MELDQEIVAAPHGRKRLPEDDLTSDQRLAKRFHLLNLENARQLYIPTQPPSPGSRRRANAITESMSVDDSKHKVFIHDLDAEIADSEPYEERLVFIPDIERRLAQLPRSVLASDTAPKGNEVVLYSVPESLSIPKEQDIVRRAIIEARERAREQHLDQTANVTPKEAPTTNGYHAQTARTHSQWQEDYFTNTNDDDAMDMG